MERVSQAQEMTTQLAVPLGRCLAARLILKSIGKLYKSYNHQRTGYSDGRRPAATMTNDRRL